MATINPYLSFKDNCETAFEHYRSVFGGEFEVVMRVKDLDMGIPVPDGAADLILHMALPIGGNILMGSDCPEGFGPPLQPGNNFSVSVSAESKEEADRVYNELSAGGVAAMPMGRAVGIVFRDVDRQVRYSVDGEL